MSLGLAYVASCGIVYANFISVFVHGLQRSLHMSPEMAGAIASSNLLGGALGSLVAALGARWFANKQTALTSLAIIALLDVASVWVHSPQELLALRGFHGVAAGLLIGFVYRLIAGSGAPERALGISLVIQIAESAASLYVFPTLPSGSGMGPIYIAMAGLELLGLAITMVIPATALIRKTGGPRPLGAANGARPSRAALMACAALLLYQCSRFMGAGFAFDFGAYLGLPVAFVGLTLGTAGWAGGAGAAVAAFTGTRFGRWRVLLAAVAVQVAASMALLGCHDRPVLYAVLVGIEGFTAIFAIPYFFGVCMAADRDGRLATWSSFISKIGLAAGPVLGGLILARTGFPVLVGTASAVGLIALWLARTPARLSEAR